MAILPLKNQKELRKRFLEREETANQLLERAKYNMIRTSNYLQELARSDALKTLQESLHQKDLKFNFFVIAAETSQKSQDGFYIDKTIIKNHVCCIYQKRSEDIKSKPEKIIFLVFLWL